MVSFHCCTQKKRKTPAILRFFTPERKLYCWNRRSTQNIFLLNYFLSREMRKHPGSFPATLLLSNDIVLKCYVFKVKCQNREGVCVIYIYTYRERPARFSSSPLGGIPLNRWSLIDRPTKNLRGAYCHGRTSRHHIHNIDRTRTAGNSC